MRRAAATPPHHGGATATATALELFFYRLFVASYAAVLVPYFHHRFTGTIELPPDAPSLTGVYQLVTCMRSCWER